MIKCIKFIRILHDILYGYVVPRCVGVDISNHDIKMVELHKDSLIISNYSIKKVISEEARQYTTFIEDFAIQLSNEWSKFTKKYNYAAIKISNMDVIIKKLLIPIEISHLEINKYLHHLLIQELGIDNIEFDYQIIETHKEQQLLSVIVAKTDKIEECHALMDIADIQVAAIEVEVLALENLLRILFNSNNISGDKLLVDVGNGYIKVYLISDCRIIHFDVLTIDYNVFITQELEQYEQEIISKQIAVDIKKIVKSSYSNIMMNKISFSVTDLIYLMGTDSLYYGLSDEIVKSVGFQECRFIDELFPPQPRIKSRAEFMQLITAVALATWGHSFA